MKEKELDNLIANWVTGEISTPDKEKLDRWIAENPEQKSILDNTKSIWETSAAIGHSIEVNEDLAWSNVASKLKHGKAVGFHQNKAFWAIAASFALLLTVGYVFFNTLIPDEVEEEAFSTHWSASQAAVSKALADGSVVVLNKGAKLSMPSKFSKNERHVKLEGEASFDVKRMPEKPFIIDAGSFAHVQVLGTSFNVKANADGSVEVKVRTGKVKLFSADNNEVILLPDDLGYFNPKTKEITKSTNSDPNYDLWRTKRLVFNNTELAKVVEVLSGYYETSIDIDSKGLKKMRLTATFANEPLDQVLELIKESLEIDVVKSGSKFTIIEKENVNYMFE